MWGGKNTYPHPLQIPAQPGPTPGVPPHFPEMGPELPSYIRFCLFFMRQKRASFMLDAILRIMTLLLR
jgi:hypothetical protein